jgi:hypothetical protein
MLLQGERAPSAPTITLARDKRNSSLWLYKPSMFEEAFRCSSSVEGFAPAPLVGEATLDEAILVEEALFLEPLP